MININRFAAPPIVLLLGACLMPSHWENQHHPAADWNADHYYCTERAKDYAPPASSGYGSPAVAVLGEIARLDSAYKQCMAGLGWREVSGPKPQIVKPPTESWITFTLFDTVDAKYYLGTASFDGSGHGNITVPFVDGETLKGQYTTSIHSGSQSPGSAAVVGDRGTSIQCEYVVDPRNHGRGDCKDNGGKKYKVLF